MAKILKVFSLGIAVASGSTALTAWAQTSTLPRQEISGKSLSNFGVVYGSWGGGSLSGGKIPEAVNGFANPVVIAANTPAKKPKKTPAQKAAAVAECNRVEANARAENQTIYTATMGVCASGRATWYGYLQEQWMRVGVPLVGGPAQDCVSLTTNAFRDGNTIIERRYQECVVDANKD